MTSPGRRKSVGPGRRVSRTSMRPSASRTRRPQISCMRERAVASSKEAGFTRIFSGVSPRSTPRVSSAPGTWLRRMFTYSRRSRTGEPLMLSMTSPGSMPALPAGLPG